MQIMDNYEYLAVSLEGSKGIQISILEYNDDDDVYKESEVFSTDRVEKFGFAPRGGHLMFVSEKGQVLGLCPVGQFYDDAKN